MMLYGPDAPPVAIVRNLVSSVSLVAALSVAVLSVSVAVVSLLSEHAVKPNVALSITDNSNGDFRELSIEFILEVVSLIFLIALTYAY